MIEINLILIYRWFQADGSFHFIHGYDIAQVVIYLLENSDNLDTSYEQKFVLGNQPLTVDRAIQEICDYLNKKIYLQISLPIWLANIFIKVFNIQMGLFLLKLPSFYLSKICQSSNI